MIADLWWRRERVLKTADTRAANLASVVAEYVRGSFSSADAALRQIAIHARRIGGASAAHADWDPILAAAKTALPEGSGSISVTDREGTITHSIVWDEVISATARMRDRHAGLAISEFDLLAYCAVLATADSPGLRSATTSRSRCRSPPGWWHLLPAGRSGSGPSAHSHA